MPLREARWWGRWPSRGLGHGERVRRRPAHPTAGAHAWWVVHPPALVALLAHIRAAGHGHAACAAVPSVRRVHRIDAVGGGPSPRERERERRLRFASPPRSWYAPPPPPVPAPALSPPFYAPPCAACEAVAWDGSGDRAWGRRACREWAWEPRRFRGTCNRRLRRSFRPRGRRRRGGILRWQSMHLRTRRLYLGYVVSFCLRVQLMLNYFFGCRSRRSYSRFTRYFFERHSDYFVRLLSAYVFGDMSHVFLPGVKKADFECLLSVFYPEYASYALHPYLHGT